MFASILFRIFRLRLLLTLFLLLLFLAVPHAADAQTRPVCPGSYVIQVTGTRTNLATLAGSPTSCLDAGFIFMNPSADVICIGGADLTASITPVTGKCFPVSTASVSVLPLNAPLGNFSVMSQGGTNITAYLLTAGYK